MPRRMRQAVAGREGPRPIRVLIVEDKKPWLAAIDKFYRAKLGARAEIAKAETYEEAYKALRQHAFELLSLDINLGEAGSTGLSLLRRAADIRACKGVVVISAAERDKDLKTVLESTENYEIVAMRLDAILEEKFPGRWMYYRKQEDQRSIDDHMRIWEQSTDFEQLARLAGPLPPYEVVLTQKAETPGDAIVVTVRSQHSPPCPLTVRHPADRDLLIALREAPRLRLADHEVLRVYDGIDAEVPSDSKELRRVVQMRVQRFRGRIEDLGVDPDYLVVVERDGFRLAPGVRIRDQAESSSVGKKKETQLHDGVSVAGPDRGQSLQLTPEERIDAQQLGDKALYVILWAIRNDVQSASEQAGIPAAKLKAWVNVFIDGGWERILREREDLV